MGNPGPKDERRRESTVDQHCRALAHGHRRRIVETLDRRESASLDELAEEIGNGTDSPASTDRIRASLRHHHLPALERVGAVEVDGPIVEARRAGLDALSNLLACVPGSMRLSDGSSGGARDEGPMAERPRRAGSNGDDPVPPVRDDAVPSVDAGTEHGPDDGGVEPASTATRVNQPPDRGRAKRASKREGSR